MSNLKTRESLKFTQITWFEPNYKITTIPTPHPRLLLCGDNFLTLLELWYLIPWNIPLTLLCLWLPLAFHPPTSYSASDRYDSLSLTPNPLWVHYLLRLTLPFSAWLLCHAEDFFYSTKPLTVINWAAFLSKHNLLHSAWSLLSCIVHCHHL